MVGDKSTQLIVESLCQRNSAFDEVSEKNFPRKTSDFFKKRQREFHRDRGAFSIFVRDKSSDGTAKRRRRRIEERKWYFMSGL